MIGDKVQAEMLGAGWGGGGEICVNIWDSVQLNHPYGTFSKFPEQAKEK